MALTAAERARRSRAHKKGDHSLCDSERCEQAPATPRDGRDDPPPGLRERGRWLWRQMIPGQSWGPAQRVMIEEACRLADRMDQLDRLLRGDIDVWARLLVDEDTGTAALVVDRALGEARMHATAYKQILAELRQGAKGGTAKPAASDGAERPAGGSGIGDLTARIRDRQQAAG